MHQKLIKQSVFNTIVRLLNKVFPPVYKTRKASNEIPWRDACRNNVVVWQTVYKRFQQWRTHGTFNKLWDRVIRSYGARKMKTDNTFFNELYIDSTQVKNIGGGDCLGRNPTDRGRLGTKVSLICDNSMTVVGSVMAPSNVSDISLTEATIESIPTVITARRNRNLSYLVADKGYSSYNLSQRLDHRYKLRLIAPVKNNHRPANPTCRSCRGLKMLKGRHIVENTMSNLKQFKRVRTREDRWIENYTAFFYLGLVVRTLSRMI